MALRRAMPLSSKIFAVLAVLFGTAAFLIVQAERERFAALRPALGLPVSVVVARASLPRGSVLAVGSLETREIPEAFAPPGALASIDPLVGRVLAADMAAGEVVTRTRLIMPRVGPLAGLVPAGMRAVGITAPVPTGLRPGDRVDVLATFGLEGRAYTETVGFALEVVRVLKPSGTLGGSGDKAPTLVVLSFPDVAERLATATAFATVQVTVIGPDGEPSFEVALPPSAQVSS
jgi:pilus assembly protein CpaB